MTWYLWFETYFPFVILAVVVVSMAILAYLEITE